MRIAVKMPTKSSDTFFISKYGFKRVLISLGVVLIFAILHLNFLLILSIAYLFYLLFIYRNPEREIPYFQENSVVAPVDGKVTMIETSDDGFVVMIESSILNTSILRSAVSASFSEIQQIDGSRLPVELKKAKLLNEQAVIKFTNNNLKIEHIASLSTEGIALAPLQGCSIHQGARYGYMNGGLTFLYLPKSSRISVQRFDMVRAGQTLIGYISQED